MIRDCCKYNAFPIALIECVQNRIRFPNLMDRNPFPGPW